MNIPIWKLAIVSIVSIVSITKLLTGRGGGEAEFKYRPFTACHSSSLFIKPIYQAPSLYLSTKRSPPAFDLYQPPGYKICCVD